MHSWEQGDYTVPLLLQPLADQCIEYREDRLKSVVVVMKKGTTSRNNNRYCDESFQRGGPNDREDESNIMALYCHLAPKAIALMTESINRKSRPCLANENLESFLEACLSFSPLDPPRCISMESSLLTVPMAMENCHSFLAVRSLFHGPHCFSNPVMNTIIKGEGRIKAVLRDLKAKEMEFEKLVESYPPEVFLS